MRTVALLAVYIWCLSLGLIGVEWPLTQSYTIGLIALCIAWDWIK